VSYTDGVKIADPADEPADIQDVFVARQPIFNSKMDVYGYELLYRSSMSGSFDAANGARATSDVITASFLNIGIDRLVGGARAFINFDAELLLSAVPEMLPPGKVVIELLESISVTDEVIAKCRKLKQSGFQIALDDFSCQHQLERLIPLADIIKIDFRETSANDQRTLAAEFRRRKIRTLAEKVETPVEFQSASMTDYTYFQGYFFARPATMQGSRIRPVKQAYFRLLEESAKNELDFRRIEDLLKHEPVLTSQLLRYLNSALFGWNGRIRSIRHALSLLGTEEFRKWAAMIALSGIAGDCPRVLVATSIIRGRFCELVGTQAGLWGRRSELFLMGLLSLLDAILNQKFSAILPELHLPSDVNDVLIGNDDGSPLSRLHAMAKAFERADWRTASDHALALKVPESALIDGYYEAVRWANQLSA
jgi:c-di-GMP-related signal transduction protein